MGHGGFLSEVRTHSRYLAWLWCQTFCEPITTARSYARFCVTKKGFIFHSPQNACSLPERTASSQMFHDELDRFYFTWGVEGHVNRSKTHVSPTDCAAYTVLYMLRGKIRGAIVAGGLSHRGAERNNFRVRCTRNTSGRRASPQIGPRWGAQQRQRASSSPPSPERTRWRRREDERSEKSRSAYTWRCN